MDFIGTVFISWVILMCIFGLIVFCCLGEKHHRENLKDNEKLEKKIPDEEDVKE